VGVRSPRFQGTLACPGLKPREIGALFIAQAY